MAGNRRWKNVPVWGRGLIIAAGVAVLLLGASFGAKWWLEAKIGRLLAQASHTMDGGSYSISAGKVRVGMLNPGATLQNVKIKSADGSAAARRGPVSRLDLSVKRIEVQGIRYRKGRNGQKPLLKVKSVEIVDPVLKFDGVPHPVGEAAEEPFSDKWFARNFREFAIDELSVTGVDVDYSYWNKGEKAAYMLRNGSLSVEDMDADTLRQGTVLLSDRVRIAADAFVYTYKNGAMMLRLDTAAIDSKAQTLSARAVGMVPQYGKGEYASRVPEHPDWTGLRLSDWTMAVLFRKDCSVRKSSI